MEPDLEAQISEEPEARLSRRRILTFVAQLVVGLVVICFCIYQLTINPESPIYLPIMTSIVAYFFPSPKLKKDRRDSRGA